MSLRGYCRTLSARIDCNPAIRITRLTTMARTGRFTNRSVNRISTFLGIRSGRIRRLYGVVDDDRSAIAQLEDAGCDDLFACGHSRQHRDLIAARRSKFHKLLADSLVGLPL